MANNGSGTLRGFVGAALALTAWPPAVLTITEPVEPRGPRG